MFKKLLFSFVFVISSLFSSTLFAENNTTKNERVYLLLGQSNMAGQGLVSELDEQQQIFNNKVKLYLHGKPAALTSLNKFGPEVSFAQAMSKKYPDSLIRLIKFAPGGSLMKDWITRDVGKHYDTLIKQVKKSNGGTIPKIQGVLWMHGERDTKSKQLASHYEKNMRVFIKMLESDFHKNNLPVALARISMPVKFRPAVTEVRVAQARVAQSSTSINMFSTDDLSKIKDQVHFDTKGQLVLGRRFFESLNGI